jgi:DNA-binding NarL/FixJ family response regulator
MSPSTVEYHVRNEFRKLSVTALVVGRRDVSTIGE